MSNRNISALFLVLYGMVSSPALVWGQESSNPSSQAAAGKAESAKRARAGMPSNTNSAATNDPIGRKADAVERNANRVLRSPHKLANQPDNEKSP
jgi:hypothetical protein